VADSSVMPTMCSPNTSAASIKIGEKAAVLILGADLTDSGKALFSAQHGAYTHRKVDEQRHAVIRKLLEAGLSWSQVQKTAGCSRSTVAAVKKRMSSEDEGV
jgi:hypothetical protein